MTTVEAMQNYCFPIVFDGGGQREIVDHGVNGFRFRTTDELKDFTLAMRDNKQEREIFAKKTFEKGIIYSSEVFKKKVTDFFEGIEKRLTGVEPNRAN